jgi:hypothetical protein
MRIQDFPRLDLGAVLRPMDQDDDILGEMLPPKSTEWLALFAPSEATMAKNPWDDYDDSKAVPPEATQEAANPRDERATL